MNTAMRTMKTPESQLTIGVKGSFGVLQFAVLAFTADHRAPDQQRDVVQSPWLVENLLSRGFRPARSADIEDTVLKAQPGDGSISCRVSTDGKVSVLVDNSLVWSRQVDPEDQDTARWIKAARSREVTVVIGGLIRDGQSDDAARWRPEVMAKVATVWVP